MYHQVLFLSMIAATVASPVTLTAVRNISNGRSTPRISANPSAGTPMEESTIVRIT